MVRPIDPFSAPVPGESLTKPKGAAPYEQPPKYTHPNEALSYLWDELTKKRRQAQLVQLLKNGAPAEALARITIFQGAAKGYFSFDLGLSIANTTHQMIVSIGHRAVANGLLKPNELIIHSPDKEMEDFMSALPNNSTSEDEEIEEVIEEDDEDLNILGGI